MRKTKTKSNPAPASAPASIKPFTGFRVWLMAALLVLVTIGLYWPATRCGFVNYDDNLYITENPHVMAGLNWQGVKWAFFNRVAGNWHPLTVMSHMLDCQLFGLQPWGHHLINVLLHALNAMLVFVLLQRLTGALWRSVLVAALFGWHPLHVESVAWVAERKDVLSTFFGLLALLSYVCYVEKSKVRSPRSRLFYGLTLLFFGLGLMSKPMLVTWPFVMLLLDYWPLQRVSSFKYLVSSPGTTSSSTPNGTPNAPARDSSMLRTRLSTLVFEKLPFFGLAAAASIVTYVVQKHSGAMEMVHNLSLGARSGNALISYCRYLGKLFRPVDLAVFYPHPGNWPVTEVLLAAGFIFSVTVLCIMARRQYPFLLVGWLWYVGTLVPVIGLIQAGEQAMADRYTYIPSLGILILTIWGMYELGRRWRHQALVWSVAGGAAIVLCLGMTRQQLGYWQNDETLFRHALAVTENNFLAHNGLGFALGAKGQIDEAINQCREAIRLKPDFAKAHNNLGTALGIKGQTPEAVSEFQEAIRLAPKYADAHYNLGTTLFKTGQIDEAIGQFREAVRLKPDFSDAHFNLGFALATKGQIDEAISQYEQTIRLKPDDAEARSNLAHALEMKNAPAGR
jgi:protein O-mannosyl-transferase